MEKILMIVGLVVAILNICLFFKFWIMCNDIYDIKRMIGKMIGKADNINVEETNEQDKKGSSILAIAIVIVILALILYFYF